MATDPNCPLCLENHLFEGDVIARTVQAYLSTNIKRPGAYLIIPLKHIEDPLQLPDGWWRNLQDLLPQTPNLLGAYNISLNLGRDAGQTLKHLHFWVIPRAGDTPASGKGLAQLIDEANQG